MLNKLKILGALLAIVLACPRSLAQSEVVIYQDADAFMRQGQYDLALEAFRHIADLPDVAYKVEICSLMSKRYRRLSMERFLGFAPAKKNDPLYFYWLGKIYFSRLEYTDASAQFGRFMELSDKAVQLASYREEVSTKLDYVAAIDPGITIEQLEGPINSKFAELSGVLLEGGDQLLFASDRQSEGKYVIYSARKGPYGWDTPRVVIESSSPFEQVNVLQHRDGFALLNAEGALQLMAPVPGGWEQQGLVSTGVLREACHIYMNKYKTRLVFSRKTADQGLDIFEAVKLRSTGEWLEATPMSIRLISPYDEDFPFITDDRQRIYFSSDRPGGLGGHDIYYADFDAASDQWGAPVNMGLPINSVDDDLDFRLVLDGQAVFSSNRAGSTGDFDLYVARPGKVSGSFSVNLPDSPGH